MSPVHVIVGDDPRAEAMWGGAFQGAVDLYRFDRNVEAFERLTAAQAPIDLVVLTPAQRGPFNLTPDQFVARVLEGPLASSSTLRNLHVIVVGSELQRHHPRAMSVSTLDAAIRLVKFGEVERAPRPAPIAAPAAPAAPSTPATAGSGIGDLPFSGSVISKIWDAGDNAARRAEQAAPAAPVQPAQVSRPVEDAGHGDVVGGGAAAQPEPVPVQAQLFSRAAPAGFVAAGGGAANAPAQEQAAVMAAPAGEPIPVGAPGEAIEVATGALQAARPYQLPGGGTYRGPAVRGGVVHAAAHDGGGQPVPPALASQVEAMVYGGGVQVGNPHDPVMVWSAAARGEQLPAPGAAARPATPQAGAQPAQPQHAAVRTVPMDPPPGAYQGVAPQQAAPAPAPAADPFLRRAEATGGDVSFG